MAHGENMISGWLVAAAAALLAKFVLTPGGLLHLAPGPLRTAFMAFVAFFTLGAVLMSLLIIPNALDGGTMRRYAVLCALVDPPALLWAAFRLAPVLGCGWLWKMFLGQAAVVGLACLAAAVAGTVWRGALPWQEEWLRSSMERHLGD